MRYTCGYCGKWVKDKFIFGTLHICLTDEEKALVDQQYQKNSIYLGSTDLLPDFKIRQQRYDL